MITDYWPNRRAGSRSRDICNLRFQDYYQWEPFAVFTYSQFPLGIDLASLTPQLLRKGNATWANQELTSLNYNSRSRIRLITICQSGSTMVSLGLFQPVSSIIVLVCY